MSNVSMDAVLPTSGGPPTKCPHCSKTYWYKHNLDGHLTWAHPEKKNQTAFEKAVDHEPKNFLKSQLLHPSALITPTKEQPYKEAPMNGTLTMDSSQLAAAKKQRDKLRTSFRQDITKFANKFGVTEFEAAHAVMDTVLSNVDDISKSYNRVAMPNGLAQTLLPYTSALLGNAVEPDPVMHAKKPCTPSYVPQGSPIWSEVWAPPLPKLKKAKPKKDGTLKPDTAVTVEDCDTTKIVANHKQYNASKKAAQTYTDLQERYFFLLGNFYVSTYDKTTLEKYPELKNGYNYPVIAVKKTSPYIRQSWINKFGLSAPTGYKFRKLKNKPIYKIMKDPKQSYYWKKQAEKAEATTMNTVQTPSVSPMPEKIEAKGAVDGYPYKLNVGQTYTECLKTSVILPDDCFWKDTPTGSVVNYTLMKKDAVPTPETIIAKHYTTGQNLYLQIGLSYSKAMWKSAILPNGVYWDYNPQTDGYTLVKIESPKTVTAVYKNSGIDASLIIGKAYGVFCVDAIALPKGYVWEKNSLKDTVKVVKVGGPSTPDTVLW